MLNGTLVDVREGSRGLRGVRAVGTGDPNTLIAVVIEDTSRQLTDTLLISLTVTRNSENWTLATNINNIYYELKNLQIHYMANELWVSYFDYDHASLKIHNLPHF